MPEPNHKKNASARELEIASAVELEVASGMQKCVKVPHW